jgi:hypothetical protein
MMNRSMGSCNVGLFIRQAPDALEMVDGERAIVSSLDTTSTLGSLMPVAIGAPGLVR